MRGNRLIVPIFWILALFLLATEALWAQRIASARLLCRMDPAEGHYSLEGELEFAGGGASELSALNSRIAAFLDSVQLHFDGIAVLPEREIEAGSEVETGTTAGATSPPSPRVRVRLYGEIPSGAETWHLHLSASSPIPLVMTFPRAGRSNPHMQVILPGEQSRPLAIGGPRRHEDGTNAAPPAASPRERGEHARGRKEAFLAGWRSYFTASPLPALLVLGMLLLTLGRTSVLWQMGVLLTFQGLTLGLYLWEVAKPAAWMAPALGVVVAIVALEAGVHRRVRWWRYLLLAAAGILQAGVVVRGAAHALFHQVGELPTDRILILLLGSQVALLTTLLVGAVILLPLSRFETYRRWVVWPLALLLALAALWMGVVPRG